jgi:cation transport ATPase
MTRAEREEVWNNTLDADMNARYYRYLAARYRKREKIAKVFLAAMGSSAIASWAIWAQAPWLWQMLLGSTSALSVVRLVSNNAENIATMSELHAKWAILSAAYDSLWTDMQTPTAKDTKVKFEELQKEEKILIHAAAKLPSDSKLINRCFDEVLTARGLSEIETGEKRKGLVVTLLEFLPHGFSNRRR